MNGQTTMYLVGQITADPRTYEWRDNVVKHFEGRAIRIFNPCDSDFDRKKLLAAEGDNTLVIKMERAKHANILVPKDRSHVRESHVILANLNTIDPDKQSVGTFFELAWAYEQPYTVVIGIFDGNPNTNPICSHPFVRSAVHTWVKNEQQACRLVEKFIEID